MTNTLGIVQRLEEVAVFLRSGGNADEAIDAQHAVDELRRLHALLNTPHTADFLQAVALEAAHQRERWGTEHDAGKEDTDWFWLLGYLGGKAVQSAGIVAREDPSEYPRLVERHREKALHHIITCAAACLNWHAARVGADSSMRPGIVPPGCLGSTS